ncbi:hypothetical protein GKZ90_0025085 [Flavobacterium sp. MC2016-06]|jgi:hypothetical protein|uniref:hypothetical protein n=1 Tax=Flavobacterium sp. MC2016-06 TaxID=2676308 RepID=UPI0012BAA084|nr:hypothetical protein [Flavobacterium sp. MC2016-06]MBU3862355.1 hypothetical protein [Flavobacterium sp. MC2016-06]
MKKIFLLTLVLSQTNFAQSIFPTDGSNVGIGTLNPTSNLEIRENINTSVPAGQIAPTKSILKFSRNGTTNFSYHENAEFRLGHGGSSVYGSKLDLYINGNSNTNSIPDQHVMTWNYNGNVGLGTTAPRAVLDVAKNAQNGVLTTVFARLPEGDYVGDGTFLGVRGYSTSIINGKSFSIEHSFYNITNSSINFYRGGSTSGGGISFNTDSNKEQMRIDMNGNVGIGTLNPQNKLDVNGTIHSKEVKVDINGWPDFVFKKEYNLPTLEEVENHINENGHLVNIPSEEEALKNGISLGEMNAKLLQKIEELTLYMIEIKKENTQMKNKQSELEKLIIELNNKIK